jgi:hypothetical protein
MFRLIVDLHELFNFVSKASQAHQPQVVSSRELSATPLGYRRGLRL